MNQLTSSEFESVLLRRTCFIDVRSPIEFDLGSIPGAVNLPLLTNDERHQIGVVYKTEGQAAAIALGHHLVSGLVKAERLEAWCEQIQTNPDSVVYCFRGGLRSQIVQSWLREAGYHVPIVEGGYKALRQFCLQTIDSLPGQLDFQVVSGPTGSGKTNYLNKASGASIDLEALAHHRGSAFGAMTTKQPTQIDFENQLAVELLKAAKQSAPVFIEDESQQIGHRLIPAALYRKMQASPKLILNVPIEVRVEAILNDYVVNSTLGTAGDIARFSSFKQSVRAISRKLGGSRTQEILIDLENSQKEFESTQTFETNRIWIRKLLEWYYDPFYNFASERNKNGRL
jgi:tRNA 2-selenouridine synthase